MLYQQRTQAHFARVMLTMATRSMFFYFSEKRHKIVEMFALLTTELSSYKMCKVGMLYVNKILALAGLTRARQCTGNNFAKSE